MSDRTPSPVKHNTLACYIIWRLIQDALAGMWERYRQDQRKQRRRGDYE